MDKIDDIDFINGDRTETFKPIQDPITKKITYYFEIEKNKEKRQYPPIVFLQLVLEAHYKMADKTKKFRKQLMAIANAESVIRRYIIQFELEKLGYDCSNIFKDIEVTEKRLKAYHEHKEKWTFFWAGFFSSFISAIVSGLLIWYMTKEGHIKPLKTETEILNIPKFVFVQDTVYDTIRVK